MTAYYQITGVAQSMLEIVDTVRFIHQKGWTPATSGNFSFRVEALPDVVFMSRSGIDKALFSEKDLIPIAFSGKPLENTAEQTSAETLLHLAIYEHTPNTWSVLHTHSKAATVLSLLFGAQKALKVQGFELLKGLTGINDHHTEITVPIFPNTQYISELAQQFGGWLQNNPATWGILIEGHGLYTWGNSIAAAKKHLEVFEFIFDCLLTLENYGDSQNTGNAD
jgi:methylthioribulose-1-phosphate dehydratase